MNDYNQLVQALAGLFDEILERKTTYIHGVLGDGNGNVDVPGRPDYSYVRESTSSAHVWPIFNKRVSGVDGTPVLIGTLRWQPGFEQVVSIDWKAYVEASWGSGYSGVAAHANSHAYPSESNPGSDPVLTYQAALQSLKIKADGSGLTITVNPLVYNYSGVSRVFPGGTIDLTGYIPSVSGYARYVLIALNPATGALSVTNGTEVPSSLSTPPYPDIPTGYIPSGFVYLENGATTIAMTDTVDARSFLAANAGGLPTGDIGQVLYNTDGSFTAETPVTDDGWLVDEITGRLIVL